MRHHAAARSLLPPLLMELLVLLACMAYLSALPSPTALRAAALPCSSVLPQTIKLGVQYSLWGGECSLCVQRRPGCPCINQLPHDACVFVSTCATELL